MDPAYLPAGLGANIKRASPVFELACKMQDNNNAV
jgi:hypothetical protein